MYPGGQLCGNFRQCLEAVQIGTCEITGTTVGGIANVFPEIQVTDLPYMFPNDRVAERVMHSEFMHEVRKAVLAKTGTLRLMGLNNTGGWRDFFTKDVAIKTPADLKGVKMRTIESPLQVEMVKLMGADGVNAPDQSATLAGELPPSVFGDFAEDDVDGLSRVLGITAAEAPTEINLAEASLKERVSDFERQLIEKALADANGNISEAARLLGVKRTTLIEKMGRLSITKT